MLSATELDTLISSVPEKVKDDVNEDKPDLP